MKLTTRKLVVTAVLAAIILLFEFTGIGYPKFGVIEMTLMAIPVIIGTIMEGLVPGLILSLFFIGTSFIHLPLNPVFSVLIVSYPLEICLILIVPRLLVPLTTWAVFRAVSGKEPTLRRQGVAAGFSAFTGSMTNTLVLLFMLYLLVGNQFAAQIGSDPRLISGVIAMIGVINGLPEVGLTVLVTIPIVVALKRVYGKANTKPQSRSK